MRYWTVARGLNVAKQHWPVRLKGLVAKDDGMIEWKLAGADAREAVATIGNDAQVEVWTQLKTYHPKTGKGLEPDLRITRGHGGKNRYQVIVENKDRRKPSKADMTEILDRYVTRNGSQVRCYMINYDNYHGPHLLMPSDPDIRIRKCCYFFQLSSTTNSFRL